MSELFDPSSLSRYSIRDRKHLVGVESFASAPPPPLSFADFLASLPDQLGARNLRLAAAAVIEARRNDRPVHASMGAHVIKVGLAPVVADLLERKLWTGLSFNGAAVVHDLEIALIGRTSEDVAESISDGTFGFARETAELYMEAARAAARDGIGLGEAVGRLIEERELPYRRHSIFAAAWRLGVPATVHCAFGTDIVHMHPEMDPEALGRATYTDFLRFAALVARLSGGVYFNIGSAVVLPEVFLKALSMARNAGLMDGPFTAVNMDMLPHYRPARNVLERPGGVALDIRGHHEIMLPLLRAALLSAGEV
ncbi:MAG: hypothetical protein DRP90_00380 [Planctomycetota bacterium]|nr:MAG: hypothetical protein DRP90_00380 [Planctomycetota bacterium]